LNGAGSDQPARRLGDADRERRSGENGDPDREHAATPDDVTGASAEQQQTTEASV
jgi:hypothetical protein